MSSQPILFIKYIYVYMCVYIYKYICIYIKYVYVYIYISKIYRVSSQIHFYFLIYLMVIQI